MEIKSKFLGEQQVDPDTIITFPNGIPGFENQHRFKLFHQEHSNIVYWLQSLDDEALTFSVTHPSHFNINYRFSLTDDEEKLLALDNSEDLLLLILLHKDEQTEDVDGPTVKGSIKSPLLINSAKRVGLQKFLGEVEQSITLMEKNSEINLSEA
ncbi:flagellar assembly protein FliW [Methylomarinum sp. Ch1-1]|uniref:Flagellar assembly factor FliW n=1 Tax=Methylomarinum roseum TaxID=3067653 RepID=A0AAU7NXV6_9GAMM|nr:flagellar assembly protein FliW [Methylomarinum sp. Ch1-1]MDP4522072.1 flagellar assembly protein FliW [Methylomarinum sp. Ch1-1]